MPATIIPISSSRSLALWRQGKVERGVAVCGSGVGASVCANKIPGVRAALVHDHFSAWQGVEDDHMNIICMGGRAIGPFAAWDLVQAYLGAEVQPSPASPPAPRQSGRPGTGKGGTADCEHCSSRILKIAWGFHPHKGGPT